MDIMTIKKTLADILSDIFDLNESIPTSAPDFGDSLIEGSRQRQLEELYPLESADPEDYLAAMQFFGPQATYALAQNIAGSPELCAFPVFRSLCIRMGQPDMTPDTAALLCDPRSSFNNQGRLTHTNPQNSIIEPGLEKILAYFASSDLAPSDFPNSKDSFILKVTLGSVSYSCPGDPDIVVKQAIRLIEEGLLQSESDTTHRDDEATLRIGTLLGAGGRALPGCGYNLFDHSGANDRLTLSDMITKAAERSEDLYQTPVNGAESFLEFIHNENEADLYPRYQAKIQEILAKCTPQNVFETIAIHLTALRNICGDSIADTVTGRLDTALFDRATKLHALAKTVARKAETDPLFLFPVQKVEQLDLDILKTKIHGVLTPPALAAPAPEVIPTDP